MDITTTSTNTMVTERKTINLETGWLQELQDEFSKPYMLNLKKFLIQEKRQNKTIYPKNCDVFNAFKLTPLDAARVVIVGQDPYHGPNQAHGLCFSVQKGIRMPPSLVNIYKELAADLHITPPNHGCLEHWARQGVLLLNSVLTVEHGKAHSHQKKGWEQFTDKVIAVLNNQSRSLVFLLWGSYAINKGSLIDKNKHLVLTAPHPSPLSAYQGFFGCKHFSLTNEHLAKFGTIIDW